MVRKIAEKSPSCNIKHLNINNIEITEIPDISNSLGQTFSNNLSSNNYSTDSKLSEITLKTSTSNLNPIIWRRINNPFSLDELCDVISKSHDSAVGPDDIHYQMLKHIPPNAVNTLLQAVNDIWFAGNFFLSWRTSTVIPIPDKDASDPNNYRPIALTSCLCKVMERMVNNRLVWFLERNKLIIPLQCGFRKQRSTTDHLVRSESFIREAFIERQHPVAVFYFRFGKGLRLYLEVRHHERPTPSRSAW